MPLLPARGRRSHEDFESDNASEPSPASSPSDGFVSSRKRARLSNETTITSQSEESPPVNGHNGPAANFQRETLQAERSRRKHQPGSIVRVKLANFVTYTAVEFFPGPSLNMVIGPNGTGKSTLVCAICLGLGWPPSTLGRAKDVGKFVKHGKQEASVEIELAKDGVKFESNIVIRCTIKRDGNKSIFSINGRSANKKQVLALARSLSIQIDNLCQFLPQDKVVEFAAMTPIELLKSTERAVASEEMIHMHERLKEFRKKQKQLQMQASADQDILSNLEGRQRMQEADVERMRERETIVKNVEMLEQAKPTVHYRMTNLKFKSAKATRKDAEKELADLNQEVDPAMKSVKAKELYKRKVETVMQQRRDEVKTVERKADAVYAEYHGLQDRSRELDDAFHAEREAAKRKKTEMAKLEGTLRELRIQLQHQPPDVDFAAYNEKTREKQRIWDQAERELRDLQRQQQETTTKGRECNQRIQDAERSLADLDSQAGQQRNKLHQISSDTARLWDWIQQHPDAFEKPVFGPPVVECSIKDSKYVDMIEALFQKTIFLSFTVQTRNDSKTLSNIAHDRLGLSEVNFKTIIHGLDFFNTPAYGAEEMRRYGFDSWALDHIDGPDEVLAMLCGEMRLHETAIAVRDSTPQQFEAIKNSNVSSWVTPKATYRISRRREYGPNATSTQSKTFKPARVWTDQPVNLTAKRQIQENINEAQEQIAAFREEVEEIKVKMAEQKEIYKKNKEEGKQIAEEKASKQKAMGEFKALPTKIEGYETKLNTIREQLAGATDRLREHFEKSSGLAMDRARTAVKYAEAVQAVRDAHSSLHEVELVLIEASSDLKTLEERNKSVKDLLDSKQKQIDELNKEVEEARKAATVWLKKVTDALKDDDGTLRQFWANLPPEQTVEDLEEEIQSERARLELMHEGNGNTIREFEHRKKKIDDLTTKVAAENDALAELNENIDVIRREWEPQLDDLVGKISASFSHNMEQISCVGEVGIWKDDDFEEWAIQIRVKFRETEPLSNLDSHRQSGGERAVSTIFYLMSLQSLTPSPFRVVDEINQGMDPRNERLVHKRMVDIACGVAASAPSAGGEEEEQWRQGSQYFLITPKLLQDLEYARGMQVLCIASGEYMPEEQIKVDFRGCVDRRKSVMGGGFGDAGSGRVGVAAG